MKLIPTHAIRRVALTSVLIMSACSASAADDALPRIQLDNVPLADAIGNLARQANLNYILDPRVPGSAFGPGRLAPKPSITARWTNVTVRTALSALLKEHTLMMVTNPATTVARIVPVDSGVQPVSASQVGASTGSVIPVIGLDFVPVTEAITKLAAVARLSITFDPQVSAPAFDDQGTVSFRWERITVRQALAALLDNYGLAMTEDTATTTARVALKAKTDGEMRQP